MRFGLYVRRERWLSPRVTFTRCLKATDIDDLYPYQLFGNFAGFILDFGWFCDPANGV
jgi:hypothetical protein